MIDYFKNIRYIFKMEESTITRTIKFSDKKCIMKPIDGLEGLTESWSTAPGVDNPRNVLFKREGITYYLVSSK
jgi:hypothetical protein